jgi:hypothetical protein
MQHLSRRSLIKTAAATAVVGSPFVWIPRIAIAVDRRSGLIESVKVYSNLTQLSALNRYAPDLETTGTTARIDNSAIRNSAVTMANNGRFTINKQPGCELYTDQSSGRVLFTALQNDNSNCCMPFFHNRYNSAKFTTLLEGPSITCLSVMAEKIFEERRSRDLCRDLLYPSDASSRAYITFESCDAPQYRNEDWLSCPLGLVTIKYPCAANGNPTGVATASIYGREPGQPLVYRVVVEYRNVRG